MMTDTIYMEEILEHYKNPLNRGVIDNADIHYHDANPLCGDEIDVFMKIDAQKNMKDIKTEGKGCAISQAAASMFTDAIKGKSIEEIRNLKKEFIFGLLQIQLSPIRVKCALLAFVAIKKGIYQYLGAKENDDETIA